MAVSHGKAGASSHGHKGAGVVKGHRKGPGKMGDKLEAKTSKKHAKKTKKMKGGRVPA